MTTETWLAYCTTLILYMLSPGPSHLLMLSNSLSSGFQRAIATACGDLSANVLQIIAVSLGLSGVVLASRHAFVVIKWLGVAYLLFLGWIALRRSRPAALQHVPQRSLKSLYLQGFLTSAANPKAIVFFAALFPLFVDPSFEMPRQFLVLGATFLIVDATFLLFYGAFAVGVVSLFRERIGRHLNVISGLSLMLAAAILGLRDVPSR